MKPITIIGGGLAGLTAGIFLRRADVPVTIYEAGSYPRHRVCGEFLSGRGRAVLADLGLEKNFFEQGAMEAKTALFFAPSRDPLALAISQPALCLSRFKMDHVLAQEYQKLGGDLRQRQRWNETRQEGVVGATGRRRAESGSGHLFGLKAHAQGLPLQADLEMHFAANRYVGICRLNDGAANVCGLFYSPEPISQISHAWKEILSNGIPILKSAHWEEDSFCAVAGITLDRSRDRNVFDIGDAAAMTPPLAGNGMSMALESAHLAFEPLLEYARGASSWDESRVKYNHLWEIEFARRLTWARVAQRVGFNVIAQKTFAAIGTFSPGLLQFFAHRTR